MSSEGVTLPADPMMGRVIGNYQITDKLGQGGMGAVYKMKHLTLPNTYMAVKVMAPNIAGAETAMLRFEQEAKAAALIGTNRVVRVFDHGILPDGTAYFTMEFIEGTDLADYLQKNGALVVAEVLKIIFQVADILVVAHSLGITHRDLKPANIMLQAPGMEPKLADWGVSRLSNEEKLIETAERAIIGTPGYMSPEISMGMEHDARTDIFSVGVIMFQLLTSKLPYPVALPSQFDQLEEYLRRPAPTIASCRPSHLDKAPEVVEQVVARAIAKDVKYRFQTLVEFKEALVGCAAWIVDNSGGRNPMLTTITQHADANVRLPSVRATPGEVERIIQRLTPAPGPTVDGYGRPATPAMTPSGMDMSQQSGVSGVRSAPSRNTPILVMLGLLLMAAVGVGAWLLVKPKPAAPAAVAIDENPTGRFLVSTAPSGATVLVNGSAIGTSPLIVNGKPGQTRRVRLSLAGYEEQEVTIEFANDDRKAEFALIKSSAPERDAVPEAVKPEHHEGPSAKHTSRASNDHGKPGAPLPNKKKDDSSKSMAKPAGEEAVNPWQQ